jgi:hypothetical protein
MSCLRCSPSFDPDNVFEWTFHGMAAPMHPNYEAELTAIRGGSTAVAVRRARPGDLVRVIAPGEFQGAVGRVEKRGRTRYHVHLPQGRYTVPFALAEPVDTEGGWSTV